MINQVNQSNGEYQINKPKPIQQPKNGVTLQDVAKAQPNFAKQVEAKNNLTERNGEYYDSNDLINYDQEVARQQAKEDQERLWAREDALREHVEKREDNAFSRWLADVRRSGANPNLVLGATGAASGGGITNASKQDYTLQDSLLQGEINKALADLERAFQGRENERDRLNRIFSTLGLGTIMRIGK